MTDDLLARLRTCAELSDDGINFADTPLACREAAALIEAQAAEMARHTEEWIIERAVGQRQLDDLAAENARLREALTPSGATKAAYIGEFHFSYDVMLPGAVAEKTLKVAVPWTTIKEIMAAIRARAALKDREGGE